MISRSTVVSSLIGMLIYIWLRFELRFGVGAVDDLLETALVAQRCLGVAHLRYGPVDRETAAEIIEPLLSDG